MQKRTLQLGSPEEAGLSKERLEYLSSYINNLVKRGCFPGAVVLVARRGRVAFYRAYGYAQKYPEKRLMTKNTIFDLASLTKVVSTTPVIMSLIEDGYLELWDTIRDYIPNFNHRKKSEITLWHLLTHTSGLPNRPLYSILSSPADTINFISQVELDYAPGTRVQYSDLGMILLGYIAEKVSGKSLEQLFNERIRRKLKLNDTMYNPPQNLKHRIAATEFCKWRKRIIVGEVHDENAYFLGGVAGHAGLFSTAWDLAVYAQTLLNGGIYEKQRILSPLSIKLMTKNHLEELGEFRGLGWVISPGGKKKCSCGNLLSERAFGHTGFTGTSLWIDPTYQLIIVLLTNRIHPTRANTCLIRERPRIHNIIASAII